MKTEKRTTILLFLCVFALHTHNIIAQGAEIKPDMKFSGTKIISITSDEMSLRTLELQAGTTVVWINNTQRIMELEFTGEQVVMACGSPVNFYVDETGSYSSNKVMPNATASLCFVDKGTYDYEVVFRSIRGVGPGGSVRKTFKGKVVVK